jgi:cyclophilin family peptidyl-prolyl cis-trans isomerase
MERNKLLLAGFILVAFGIFLYFVNASVEKTQTKSVATNEVTPTLPISPTEEMKLKAPKLTIDSSKTYTAEIITELGTMTVELNATSTPVTVNNFVYLAKKKFYNKTVFHRVIEGFMIQGGDPKGDGTGGPGYKFNDEPITENYTRGTLAMANSGPNTNGSQFFIMHKDYPLPKNYVIFGKVTKGLEVLDAIASAEVAANPYSGEVSVPVSPVKIVKINILEN